MSTRGLPGFLRRSRRWNDDFEDEDNDTDDNDTGDGVDNQDGDGKNDAKQKQYQKQQQNDGVDNEPYHLMNASLQFLDPSPLAASSVQGDSNAGYAAAATGNDAYPNGGKDPYPDVGGDPDNSYNLQSNNDDHSLSTIGDYDPTLAAGVSRSTSNVSLTASKVGYREAQFEKILSDNVVKLSELRKIGWNGIPVRYAMLFSERNGRQLNKTKIEPSLTPPFCLRFHSFFISANTVAWRGRFSWDISPPMPRDANKR
jgi:hypothetical protein